MNTNEFFLKNYFFFLKKGKIFMYFGKNVKWKMVIRMHYSQAEMDIPPKMTLQPDIFPLIPFIFNVINGLMILSTMKYGQNIKIVKIHETIFSSKFHGTTK